MNKKDSLGDRYILSREQLEVLHGAMLGDGCLIKHKNGTNAYFSYLSKSRQHVEFVANYFQDYWTCEAIKDNKYLDSRTNKIYFNSRIKTHSNEAFTDEYLKWYSNGVKHIPKDLKLTSLMCLIWYIGDGCICHSKNTQYIKLATHCFSKEEQQKILISQLQDFEAKLIKSGVSKCEQQQYSIYIPRRKIKNFLNFIGSCPFSDYKYKWNYKEYTNFSLSQHPEFIQSIMNYFNNGMSANTIAKQLNVDRSTVVKYLVKNGLNPKDNLYKKKKVGDDNEEQ